MSSNTGITCIRPEISLQEMLSGLLVTTPEGLTGLAIVETTAPGEDLIQCGEPNMSPEDVLRRAIVLHDNKPAILLVRKALET